MNSASEMIEVKTADLTGPALDWAVGIAVGGVQKPLQFADNIDAPFWDAWIFPDEYACTRWSPSTEWHQGGRLIDQHLPLFTFCRGQVRAEMIGKVALGDTYLIAACRAIVAAKLGESVSVPSSLVEGGPQ
ncbi:phage protein NinX family protein [Pseudomonas sp. SP16.1]|uniref:phage protein NinX family protein n=1 Tax=Pseudomonas sp. SP16.1 TaxID=3458854 RepID=UPI0040460FB5